MWRFFTSLSILLSLTACQHTPSTVERVHLPPGLVAQQAEVTLPDGTVASIPNPVLWPSHDFDFEGLSHINQASPSLRTEDSQGRVHVAYFLVFRDSKSGDLKFLLQTITRFRVDGTRDAMTLFGREAQLKHWTQYSEDGTRPIMTAYQYYDEDGTPYLTRLDRHKVETYQITSPSGAAYAEASQQ